MIAEKYIDIQNERGTFGNRIVTEIVPLEHFYPAENYHQDYLANNPEQPYCVFVVKRKYSILKSCIRQDERRLPGKTVIRYPVEKSVCPHDLHNQTDQVAVVPGMVFPGFTDTTHCRFPAKPPVEAVVLLHPDNADNKLWQAGHVKLHFLPG